MFNRKNVLAAALLTAVASTSFASPERGSYYDYQYDEGYNPNYAYNVATDKFQTESETVTYGPEYGDRAGSFTVGYDRISADLQCKSCGVDGEIKVVSNVEIRDLKAYGLRDRAYSLQEGRDSQTEITQYDDGENLAISLQLRGTKNNTTEISQKWNGSKETQALVKIGKGKEHLAEIEQENTNGAVATINIDGRNYSAFGNIAEIEQETADSSIAGIEIDGRYNKAEIEQERNDGAMAAIRLIGSDNNVEISQEAANTSSTNVGNIAIVDFAGNQNNIDVEQSGNMNIAYVESINKSDYSSVDVTQNGDNNQGYVLIGGNYNTVTATQDGTYDYFCSTQTGTGNTFVLNQTGR